MATACFSDAVVPEVGLTAAISLGGKPHMSCGFNVQFL